MCLCLFRVAFNDAQMQPTQQPGTNSDEMSKDSSLAPPGLYQQLLYRLIFSQKDDSTFTRQEILSNLQVRAYPLPEAGTNLSMAIASGVSQAQVDKEGAEAKKKQQIICDRFIKRLLRLNLIQELPS